ncbi:hypothetical protein B0T14DRAFT_285176 [Immersiella caudata]|uniref:MARVEL domain-containing protein n=1 Tax=Immersiella caudata TaxID=314043 RepID=A0AA39WE92_9PEZI|nr:hypothetical protein B0T14DRAFT_285176 [Immersiella caudata]
MTIAGLLKKIRVPKLVFRAVQGLFSVVVLALSGYVAHWYNTDTLTSSPTQINIMIFSGILSLISLILLEGVPRIFPRFAHPWEFLFLEFTNVVFWVGSGMSLTVFLSRLLFCRGSVCAAAQTNAVFSFVLMGAWLNTFIPLAMDVFKGIGRKSAPKMSGAKDGMKETA